MHKHFTSLPVCVCAFASFYSRTAVIVSNLSCFLILCSVWFAMQRFLFSPPAYQHTLYLYLYLSARPFPKEKNDEVICYFWNVHTLEDVTKQFNQMNTTEKCLSSNDGINKNGLIETNPIASNSSV